jgi:AcrR family transcriptional regulator
MSMEDRPNETSDGTRAQQAQATRQRIAEAALDLFSRNGFAATSTKAIADEAGVSEGLIFHHFGSKLDLLMAIPTYRPTIATAIASALENTDQPAETVLRGIAKRFVALARDEAAFINLILGESRSNDDLYAGFRTIFEGSAKALSGYLEARAATGELRQELATDTAASGLIGGLLLFLMANKHLTDDEWQQAADQYTEELIDVWLIGALDPTRG